MDKRYTTCLLIALVLHSFFIFFFRFQEVMARREAEKLVGVEYREEKEKKKEKKKEEKKKEPKKLITPKEATVSLKDKFRLRHIKEKIDEEDLKKLAQIARPMEIATPDMKIDIDKMLALHQTQIDVNLDEFEALDLADGVDVDILRLGAGKSTQEILQEDVIRLPAAATLGKKVGLFTTPGVGGVEGEGGGIELDKASSADISSQREEMRKAMQKKKTEATIESEGPRKAEVKMEISVALRERLLKMVPPPYPDWAQQQGLGGTLTIQLRVDENGKICGMPITISTTGYPEWDNMVIKWIKNNWKWAKKPGVAAGTVTIRFIIG